MYLTTSKRKQVVRALRAAGAHIEKYGCITPTRSSANPKVRRRTFRTGLCGIAWNAQEQVGLYEHLKPFVQDGGHVGFAYDTTAEYDGPRALAAYMLAHYFEDEGAEVGQ